VEKKEGTIKKAVWEDFSRLRKFLRNSSNLTLNGKFCLQINSFQSCQNTPSMQRSRIGCSAAVAVAVAVADLLLPDSEG
jgi:hypothetical protein